MNLNLNSQNFNVGAYIRLSREDGDKLESESITNQRNIITSFIEENGYTLYKEYIDDGYSGTSFDRPGFNKLLKDIEDKKINMIITKDLSRFGRDYIKTGYYIEHFFPENMIRYISILDNIDTFVDGTQNDIMPFKSLLNDMYAKDISKKIRSVFHNKMANGQYMATYAPYGYYKDNTKKGALCVDESVRHIVVRIFNLFISGMPAYSIAKTLTKEGVESPAVHNNIKIGNKSKNFGQWSPYVIKNMLKNETYIGSVVQGKTKKINYKSKKTVLLDPSQYVIVPNLHEAIISQEVFDTAQKLLNNTQNNRTRKHEYLLKGLLYCEHCNTKLLLKVDKEKYKDRVTIREYIYCYRRNRYHDDHKVVVRYDYLENAILDKIRTILKKYANKTKLKLIAKTMKNVDKDISSLKKQIEYFESQLSKITPKLDILYEDRLNGVITIQEYQKYSEPLVNDKSRIEDNIKMIEKEINSLQLESDTLFDETANDKKLEKIIKDFLKMKVPDKATLIKLVNKITLNDKKEIKIYFNFKSLNLISSLEGEN